MGIPRFWGRSSHVFDNRIGRRVVHHTDARREYDYDRDSHIGKLDKVLDVAAEKVWTVVNMNSDWKSIFPENIEAN